MFLSLNNRALLDEGRMLVFYFAKTFSLSILLLEITTPPPSPEVCINESSIFVFLHAERENVEDYEQLGNSGS